MNLAHIIKRPVITEKSHNQGQNANKYTFEVAREANKNQIKAAIESYFGVTVTKINTTISSAERRTTGRRRLPSPLTPTKKAIVQVKKDQTISIFNQGK